MQLRGTWSALTSYKCIIFCHFKHKKLNTDIKNYKKKMEIDFKGSESDFWKPMLIFEITKTNTPLPQKGPAPILIAPPHIYIAYATQQMISSVKHKPIFHRSYLEEYVPGTKTFSSFVFYPPSLSFCRSARLFTERSLLHIMSRHAPYCWLATSLF